MDAKSLVTVSKFLSKHLRHDPEALGLTLQEGGWVHVSELLAGAQRRGITLTLDDLVKVVEQSDKKRFSFSADGEKIRANQGHSIQVDLQLQAQSPPEILFHGTGKQFVPTILQEGLKRMKRHHVHLSKDEQTAYKVGMRHGKPVIFVIHARTMSEQGFTFYLSDNGVWLTDEVPPRFLQVTS